jgi:hypothetical protein
MNPNQNNPNKKNENNDIYPLVPVSFENLDDAAEALLNENPFQQSPSSLETRITSAQDFWQIEGVQYRNGIYAVGLGKALLDNGSAHTQGEWSAHYQTAKPKNEFHTPDYPLFYAILKSLYKIRNDSANAKHVNEAQQFLRDTSRAKWLMTLTRIAYQPQGDDVIIHNHGTSDRYERRVDFITPDENITQTQKPASYQALLDTQDSVQEINNVFRWLNDTDAFAFKVNTKPANVVERIAGFYASSGRADLYCGRNPANAGSSLGVFACAKF